MSARFVWGKNDVLWRNDGRTVAGWLVYDLKTLTWAARTAGSAGNPHVRAEFDNQEAARDFLMFLVNAEEGE